MNLFLSRGRVGTREHVTSIAVRASRRKIATPGTGRFLFSRVLRHLCYRKWGNSQYANVSIGIVFGD